MLDAPIAPGTPYFDSVKIIFEEVLKANDEGSLLPSPSSIPIPTILVPFPISPYSSSYFLLTVLSLIIDCLII